MGCIHAGASLMSLMSSCRFWAGRLRLRWAAPLRGHVLLAQLAKGLDHKTAQPSRRRHVLRGGPAELNGHRANLHGPARAIRQEHGFGWHLLGKTQGIGRIRSRRLQACAVAARQGLGHGFGGWLERPEHRVLFRKVVHAAGEAANRSLLGEPVQGDIDRLAAAQVQEIRRNEHGTTAAAVDCRKYP